MATLTPASEDTRVYEFAILYPYPMHQKEEQDLLKAIEAMFDESGGKVVFKDLWGRRGLAYTIGGYGEGSFAIYYVDLDPSKVKELDQQFKILKGVLRHLIVKPPKHYQIVSYAEKYVQWQEEERQAIERAEKEKEEKLKKQVLDKAKRQTKVVKKAETVPSAEDVSAKPKPTADDLSKELDKLISDKDLEL